MDKVKLKNAENQTKCFNATIGKSWDFETVFEYCYNLLAEYGDKKVLHYSVIALTNPQVSVGTVRMFCNNISRIPEKNKTWYLKAIVSNLSRELQTKIDQKRLELQNAETALQILSEKLSETLKPV
jgi:hypothetical protein